MEEPSRRVEVWRSLAVRQTRRLRYRGAPKRSATVNNYNVTVIRTQTRFVSPVFYAASGTAVTLLFVIGSQLSFGQILDSFYGAFWRCSRARQ